MSQSAPVELFETESSRRRVTVTKQDGTIDLTSKMEVKSSNPSQVEVRIVPTTDGSEPREYDVLTPGEGAYVATITESVRGFQANTVLHTISEKIPGTITSEPVGPPTDDQ